MRTAPRFEGEIGVGDTVSRPWDENEDDDWAIPADRTGAEPDPWAIDADDWPPAPEGDDNRFPYPAGLP